MPKIFNSYADITTSIGTVFKHCVIISKYAHVIYNIPESINTEPFR